MQALPLSTLPSGAANSYTARPLTTASLCKLSRVTRGALRVYEREGVIEPPQRTGNGYRNYPPDTVARLEAVRQLKEIGFTLREIAVLLSERAEGEIDPGELTRLAQAQLASIDERIARLQVVRGYVSLVAQGDAQLVDDPECAFLHRFLTAR